MKYFLLLVILPTIILLGCNLTTTTKKENTLAYSQDTTSLYGINNDTLVLLDTNTAYGSVCGFAGVAPSGRKFMNSMLNNNDTTMLKNWLYSKHYTLKAYAIEGYYRLEKKGYAIPLEIKKECEKWLSSNITIKTCLGCTYFEENIGDAVRRELKDN